MMLPQIVQGLADRLLATPGVKSAFPVAPIELGPLPCGVVFSDPEQTSPITMGASEVWQHRLLPRLYVAKLNRIPDELEQALPFVEPFVASVRQKFQLGVNGVFATSVLGYRIGTSPYGGVDYVIVEWPVEVKAKQSTEIVS